MTYSSTYSGEQLDQAVKAGLGLDIDTLAELQAYTGDSTLVHVKGRTSTGDGYEGTFQYVVGDYSSECTADTTHVNYVAKSGVATTVGAWIRTGDWKYVSKGEPGSGSQVLTAAMLVGGLIDEDPEGNVNWTTDTAANIVAAIPKCVVGYTFECILMNDATAASGEIVTIVAGTGVTLHGDTATLTEGTNSTAKLILRVTNITASSEAVDVYIIT